jgi:glucose-6-phosphate dehydrogenase assembly protein OpcA
VTTLWDTTGTEVVKALSRERRTSGAMVSGLALTLVVVVDEKRVAEAEAAATTAAATHPCRLLVVVRRQVEASPRLDAEVLIGGRLGPGESVVLRMYGRLALHAESVTLPLLAPDAPVVTWFHGDPPDRIAHDPLGVFAERRITDCAQAADPPAALRHRAVDYAPGDTDLAWTRTTPWRGLMAAAFDALSTAPTGGVVAAERGNTSAALLAGWLQTRLGIEVRVEQSRGPGITEVAIDLAGSEREDGSVGEPERLSISRTDGRTAMLSVAGQRDRSLPLVRRDLGDLLAEELRRLDADQPYAEALAAATGVRGLSGRPAKRTHIWRDPAQEAAAETVPG